MNKRLGSLILLLIILFSLVPVASSWWLYPGPNYHVDNEYYATSSPVFFDNVTVGSHWMVFNGLGFNITSSSPIYINISYILSKPKSVTVNNTLLLLFTASSLPGSLVYFAINGLQPSHVYKLINDTSLDTLSTDSSGVLSFSRASWTTHSYGLYYTGSITAPPAVTTNTSTGVGFTNATLNGYVSSEYTTTYGFHYGPTISYGSNQTIGTYIPLGLIDARCRPTTGYKYQLGIGANPWTYSYDSSNATVTYISDVQVNKWCVYNFSTPVTIDTIYINAIGISGSKNLEVDQVNVTDGITWTTAYSDIHGTSWTSSTPTTHSIDLGGNHTVTQMRLLVNTKTGFSTSYGIYELWCRNYTYYGPWYNHTFNYALTGLLPGTSTHYRAWAINSYGLNLGLDYNLTTKPYPPTSITTYSNSSSKLYLTWTKGDGANYTRIQMNATGIATYPTTIATGTNKYNNTGTSTLLTGLRPGKLYRFSLWSLSLWGTNSKWSSNYTTTYGLTRPDPPYATSVYLPGNMSYMYVNWTKGNGTNTTRVVKKAGGYPSSPTDGTLVYNGTGSYVKENLTMGTTYYYKAWSFSKWISPAASVYSLNGTTISYNSTGGLWINVYKESTNIQLKFNVTISNQSGTQVYVKTNHTGWLGIGGAVLPKGTHCTIMVTVGGYSPRIYTIDINTGIFYILKAYLPRTTIPPPENTSYLYNLKVVESYFTGYMYTENPVQNVNIAIKRYTNASGTFETVSNLITDAEGLVNVYLMPNAFYKVFLNKTGYQNQTVDYIPAPPNAYGQTELQTFKINPLATTQNETNSVYTEIVFNATMNATGTITVYYHDLTGNTTNTQVYIYRTLNGTDTLLDNLFYTGFQSFYWNYSTGNASVGYTVVLCFNTTNNYTINRLVRYLTPTNISGNRTRFDLENRITNVFGDFNVGGVVFSWIGFFLSFIPLLVLCLFDPAHVGIGVLATGFTMGGIQLFLAMWTTNLPPPLFIVAVPVVIVIGVLYILAERNGGL